MGRPKSVFSEALAARALADLGRHPGHRVAMKLKAIAAAAKHPVACVAEVMGVAAETVWRWAVAYGEGGEAALGPKPKRGKPSKLTEGQKAAVLSWLAEGRTAKGDAAHWTLEGLRLAIAEEYDVTLGTTTIWTWLRKNGWRQKAPRPRHCKADGQAQADFKKN